MTSTFICLAAIAVAIIVVFRMQDIVAVATVMELIQCCRHHCVMFHAKEI